MNERIEKLAEQALNEYKATYHNEAKIPEAYLEKFSELIVQECILVIEENAEHIHAEGTIEAIVNLEKHFGVD